MIPIGMLILSIVLILVAALKLSKKKNSWGDYLGRFYVAMDIGIGLLIVVLLWLPLCYLGSVSRNAELEAFHEATKANYAYAIDETSKILTVSKESMEGTLIPVEGSVEKFQVGESTAQRIIEFRDACTEYNNDLNHIRALDSNILVGVLYATPSEELPLITIK